MMQSARQELQALTDAINRDRDRQITIERSIADEIALGPIAGGENVEGVAGRADGGARAGRGQRRRSRRCSCG